MPDTPSPQSGATQPRSRPTANNLSETRRRWACDRCHAQKLRCLRTINSQDGDCDRCIRVSATCSYSPPGRMGRPARSDSTNSASGTKRNRGSSGTHTRSTPNSPTPPSIPSPQLSGPAPPTPEAAMPIPPLDIPMPPLDAPMPPMDDLFGGFHSHGMKGETTMMADFLHDPTPYGNVYSGFGDSGITSDPQIPFPSFNPMPSEPLTPPLGGTDEYVKELIALAMSQYEQFRVVEAGRDNSSLDKEALFNKLHNYPIGDMLENAQKLTGLVDALLQANKPRESTPGVYWNEFVGPLDLGRDMILDADALSTTPSTTDDSMVDFSDPWGHSDRSMTMPTSSPSIGSMGSTPPPSRPRADTSTTLLVLSCYIRLARLYILFFADLHCFLLASHLGESTFNADRRLFPGLKLGSFQAFAGTGLEISMVVQVSEHMINRLHKALGLPCSQDGSETGRFPTTSGWNAMEMITPVLMRAVQAQEGMDSQDDKGDTCTQLSLAIDGVKRLLRARAFL